MVKPLSWQESFTLALKVVLFSLPSWLVGQHFIKKGLFEITMNAMNKAFGDSPEYNGLVSQLMVVGGIILIVVWTVTVLIKVYNDKVS